MNSYTLSFLTTDQWLLEKAAFAIKKSVAVPGYLGSEIDPFMCFLEKHDSGQKHLLFIQPYLPYLELCTGNKLRKLYDVELLFLGSFLPKEHIPLLQSNGIVAFISPDEINPECINKMVNDIWEKGYYANKHITIENWVTKPRYQKPTPMPNFTNREIQIISELCHGFIAGEIATKINTSTSNVRYIISNIKQKLSAKSDKEIIAICLANQWVVLERVKFNNQNNFIQNH
jgi:DNA-binding NarL/FixJ family response regulator